MVSIGCVPCVFYVWVVGGYWSLLVVEFVDCWVWVTMACSLVVVYDWRWFGFV